LLEAYNTVIGRGMNYLRCDVTAVLQQLNEKERDMVLGITESIILIDDECVSNLGVQKDAN